MSPDWCPGRGVPRAGGTQRYSAGEEQGRKQDPGRSLRQRDHLVIHPVGEFSMSL